MALIRHKTTGEEVSVPDAKAALPYFPDYEEVDDKPGGEKSTAKTTEEKK